MLGGKSPYAIVHGGKPHGISVRHRAAARARKAVAVAPDDVDILRRRGDALRKNRRALIDKRIDTALNDFRVADVARRDVEARGLGPYQRIDFGIRLTDAPFGAVPIHAASGLLTEATAFHEEVGNTKVARIVRQILTLTAHAIADVKTGKIAYRVGSHGHAKTLEHAIDALRACSLEQHELILAAIGIEHAVAHKAKAISDHDADLADLPGRAKRSRNARIRGLRGAHDLHESHDVCRAEEVHADDILRACRDARYGINIESRGVGREQHTRATAGIELALSLIHI